MSTPVILPHRLLQRLLALIIRTCCLYWQGLAPDERRPYRITLCSGVATRRLVLYIEPLVLEPRVIMGITLKREGATDGYNLLSHPMFHLFRRLFLAEHPTAWFNEFGHLCLRLK